jgi:hypothetical protein
MQWLAVAAIALVATAPAMAKRPVVIPPSGDLTGQMDYENIQAALLEATPNTVIELQMGTYYLNHVVFADNFRGTFKGAGKDVTIITSVGVLEAWNSGDDPPWLNPPSLDNPWPALFSFVDGNFTLRDMTFQITEYVPMIVSFLGETYEIMGGVIYILGGEADTPAHTQIRNVGFEGAAGTFAGYNVVQAIYHNGLVGELTYLQRGFPLTGTHIVSDCTFDTFYAGNSVYYLDESARLLARDNTFTDVVEGLEVIDSGGRIDFWNNHVEVHQSEFGGDGFGVIVLQGLYTFFEELPPAPQMILDIRDNTFLVEDGFAALDIEDWQFAFLDLPQTLFLTAQQNEMELISTTFGIYTYALTQPQVIRNELVGDVIEDGMCVELTSMGRFVLNGMSQLEAGFVPCLLDEDTFGNRVIAVDAFNDVLDMTDDPLTPEYDGLNFIISVGFGL